jgi:hypothetical protein
MMFSMVTFPEEKPLPPTAADCATEESKNRTMPVYPFGGMTADDKRLRVADTVRGRVGN